MDSRLTLPWICVEKKDRILFLSKKVRSKI